MDIIKILLIQENHESGQFIRELLSKTPPFITKPPRYEIHHANQMNRALAFLNTIRFDAILLDLCNAPSQNLKLFSQLQNEAPHLPIVIIGKDDDSMAVQAMQNGAQDYIFQSNCLNPGLLPRSLRHAIERQHLLDQLEEKTIALAESEARRRNIIEQNADGIIIVNERGIVQFVNPAAENILRSSRDKLLERPFQMPTIKKGGTAELVVNRRQGGTASVELRLVETDWKGEKAYQASLRDISDHEQREKEMKQKAETLAIENMALDEFAHTMAHQIQGLLSQMIGYASFIEMHFLDDIPDDAHLPLHRIVQSGNKMNNVITELLLLASMRSTEIKFLPLDLRRILNEVQKRLRFQIKEVNAVITVPKTWPIPLGYEAWIEEALINYLGNGLKYGGDPPILQIGATVQDDNMIRVWVKDNGPGIALADQKRLFIPHTRLQNKKVPGDGLGLSIVKRIIYRSGGKVGVENNPEGGSNFWFTLPQADGFESNLDAE